jgi:predicted lipoprotein with Yx(FWY)xxD motif
MFRLLASGLAAIIVLGACGSAGSGTVAAPSPTATATPTPSPTKAPTVKTADTTLGKVLAAASNGMTLYVFKRDTPGVSNCYDACATTWPPFVVTSDPVAPTDVKGKLATAARKDGAKQLTIDDQPLYFYSKDTKPGDVVGENVGTIWFTVKNP